MEDSPDERVWHLSDRMLGSLLGTCVAGLFTFLPLEARDTAQTVAVWCFALPLPFLIVQFLDLYREDRQRYPLHGWAQNIITTFGGMGPVIGVIAALVHVSGWLAGLFVVCSFVALSASGTPSIEAEKDEQVKQWHKQQSPKSLYVPDPHVDSD